MNIRLRVCPRCYDRPFIFYRPIVYPPDPVPKADPRVQNFQVADNGSPTTPPFPWPVPPIGPPTPQPIYLTDDSGNILTDNNGLPIVADNSPLNAYPVPPQPVYVTPPLPPLPADIEIEP